jgi:hypothetical protein
MQSYHDNVPVGLNGNSIGYIFDGSPAGAGKAERLPAAGGFKLGAQKNVAGGGLD